MQGISSDENNSPSIVELAEVLDGEGMIGFTRLFVEDIRKGLAAVNVKLMPWLENISSKNGMVLCF